MKLAPHLAVGETVWFRGGMDDRAQRGRVAEIVERHAGDIPIITDVRVEWGQGLSLAPGQPGGSAWLKPGALFPSAAAYHVHRIQTGPWRGVLEGRRSLHDGPLEFFEAHKRYYHAFARLQLAQRVAALRVPTPAGGYTKTTTFEGRACYDGDAWGFEVEGEHELEFREPRELAPPEHAAGDMGGALWGTWTVTMTFVPGKEP